jgi:hypothetical protein
VGHVPVLTKQKLKKTNRRKKNVSMTGCFRVTTIAFLDAETGGAFSMRYRRICVHNFAEKGNNKILLERLPAIGILKYLQK